MMSYWFSSSSSSSSSSQKQNNQSWRNRYYNRQRQQWNNNFYISSSSSSLYFSNNNYYYNKVKRFIVLLIFFISCYHFIIHHNYFILLKTRSSTLYSNNHTRVEEEMNYNNINHNDNNNNNNKKVIRILYCTTSISEYDNGKRETVLGYDRFHYVLIPLIYELLQSIIAYNNNQDSLYEFHFNWYLITHYPISKLRRIELYETLSSSFTLLDGNIIIWDDATPIGYAKEDHIMNRNNDTVSYITRALARQHRYVMKDYIYHYDVFIQMEDDMLLHIDHIIHYIQMMDTLKTLRTNAPMILYSPNNTKKKKLMNYQEASKSYYGPMSERMISRLIPGFMRVEVVLNVSSKSAFKGGKEFSYIKPNYQWDNSTKMIEIDPSICCHMTSQTSNMMMTTNSNQYEQPSINQLHYWETSLDALGIRKMPELLPSTNHNNHTKLDWVITQGCTSNSELAYDGDPKYIIGDYWLGNIPTITNNNSNNNNSKIRQQQQVRPDRIKGRYCNNQGGWIGTMEQIGYEWHIRWCRGHFLPPYDKDFHKDDGLYDRTVEYWSGSIQLFGPNSCNLQRIISMKDFSKHLLYHTSNNKQHTRAIQHRYSTNNIQELWGQLNTIKYYAEHDMNIEMK